jgi:signal transduction histidine kinase/ActR/RegA family two-component response regulator
MCNDELVRPGTAGPTAAALVARMQSLVRILKHRADSTRELLDFTLDEAISLTDSRIGYIYHYSEERRQLVLNSWSRDVMDLCSVVSRQTVYDLDQTGTWGEAVRQRRPIVVNDFEAPHPLKKGYPPGHVILERFLTVPIFDGDQIVAVVGVANKTAPYGDVDVLQLTLLMDAVFKVVDRVRAIETLARERQNFQSILDASPVGMLVFDSAAEIRLANPAAERIFGTTLSDLTERRCGDFVGCVNRRLTPEGCGYSPACGACPLLATIRATLAGQIDDPSSGETLVVADDGQAPRALRYQVGCVVLDSGPGMVLALEDVTAQHKLQTEKSHLESQYLQAQKLESIGRLAGGVAHDLNNMLVPILGYAEILQDELAPDSHLADAAAEISNAGSRARDLVRQLLTFSRKQTLELETVDLNDVIRRFSRLLRRTIREDIAIETTLAERLRPVHADLGQVEQVLMNLAVNAQDAMPEGGRLIIETDEAQLDGDYAATHGGVQPGDYVRLTVTDTGSGMDSDTVAQIFEPFFTTKAKDQGTGLGLSTVYGIVKQHGGNVWVYSEPGRGTTFKVYFPVTTAMKKPRKTLTAPAFELVGTETILLVEDNPQVRRLAAEMLKWGGYRVLQAGSGQEALALLDGAEQDVELMLTDVIMPDMNGKELFAHARSRIKSLRVLYMSGYTANVIAHHGVLDPDVCFIQKPFSRQDLLTRLREVLSEEASPDDDDQLIKHL